MLSISTIKELRNRKGSFTVEAAIVFSVVFILITALVYLFIIMYQYAFLQSVVDQAANVGGCYYCNQYGDDYNSKLNSNLYWRTFDKEASYKKAQLNNYISESLKKIIIDSNIYFDNSTSYKFLLKQVNVNIEAQYPLLIGNMFKIFGIPTTIDIKAQSNSPMCDNAEFVRNMDLVIDIKNCISNSDNKWIGKGSKVNDVLDKLIK